MRTLLAATTAVALTLFAGVDIARADNTTPAVTMSGNPVAADKIIGRTVVNSAREKVGEVDSVLVDKDGKIRYVIVGVGGFLGIGERDVALRWDQLSFVGADQSVVVNMTRDEMAALPAHRFQDESAKGKVSAYDADLQANPYLADQSTTSTVSNSIDTKSLIGRTVKNTNGDTVGDIESVLVDAGGNVKYVVVGVGGFLGIGEKHVALPWNSLSISDNGEKVVAGVTKEDLEKSPSYRYGNTSHPGTVSSYDSDLATNPYLADNASRSAPPVPGANSFTESQARSRIESRGFSNVSGLKKDDQSIWRGTATKDGKTVAVALDYQGNVVAQ